MRLRALLGFGWDIGIRRGLAGNALHCFVVECFGKVVEAFFGVCGIVAGRVCYDFQDFAHTVLNSVVAMARRNTPPDVFPAAPVQFRNYAVSEAKCGPVCVSTHI